MKKYVKPELFYERFELSQHIADCGWEWVNLIDGNVCYAQPDPKFNNYFGENLFFSSNTPLCIYTEETFEDICYQSGSDGMNVFQS